ncbi:secreted PhoX family phosphatase [Sphingomonas sp. BE138]|uniref:PhoX family protein n=1 Tax=Sphingomonas sp. BE138 TaxID=2817845 RepID=UPI00285B658E|nr:alkaline phosphatase PhoX [Sphingomonas sp. BE138]MDR6786868.1 secreted PhoX family phosphatase [Sphingomonas sp. BE138]
MTEMTLVESVAYDDGDIDTNPSTSTHLNELVARRYSRRSLMGGMSAMTTAVFGGALLTGCSDDDDGDVVTVSDGTTVQTQGGRVVTLSATASSNATTTSFKQVAGPTVAAVTSGNSITFVAPNVAQSTALVFEFSASNASGTSSERTTVNVLPATLDFTAVAKNKNDLVTVPANYTVTVLYRLGDPLASGVAAYANNGTDTNFAQRAGDHHDGMSYFGLAATGTAPDATSNTRGVLVMNHENITESYLHANGPTGLTGTGVRPEAEAIKEIEAHGVSVVEVTRAGNTGAWSYVQASTLNRRITPNTPMQFNGPARGNAALRTRVSSDGTRSNGTINNCANGQMPWQTYLTCEENWAGYFTRAAGDEAARTAANAAKQNVSLRRYGIGQGRTGNYRWTTVTPADASSTTFSRWNASVLANAAADGTQDFRNEPFTFGWVVEIDPFNPQSTPRKRTALGRMNHEGCWPGRTIAGVKPAFYMGDDAQNEYIYKFVSNVAWAAADATAADRLAIGDKYLDAGTLYVAKFNDDGTGTWLPLVFGQNGLTASNTTYPFADQADVLINTRLAADVLGATPMDRPEWTAVNPVNGEMYCTLTNNSSRRPVASGSQRAVDASNPRAYVDPRTTGTSTTGNANGHVIRLRETGDTTEATTFTWDIYAFGAGSDLDPVNINLSSLDATNDFSSPDGLWFGLSTNASGQVAPLLWLQTDDGAFTDVTNNQMLVGMPGRVGDGGTRQVTSTVAGASATVTTRIGAAPGAKLKRFLVGPVGCEITGISSTPDGRSVFVNIQHPGEGGEVSNITSNWPASQAGTAAGVRPRSATIVITKNDGGVVGL